MRYLISSLLILLHINLANALTIEASRSYGVDKAKSDLKILSSTDIDVFHPVLSAFSALNPAISVNYSTASTADIYRAVRQSDSQFDLIMSSAMDLQMKLVNDGFAESISILENLDIPCKLAYTSYTDSKIPQHVYCQTKSGVIVDGVWNKFNSEKKYTTKYLKNL